MLREAQDVGCCELQALSGVLRPAARTDGVLFRQSGFRIRRPRLSAGTGLSAPDMDRIREIMVIPDVVANVDGLAAARAYAAVSGAKGRAAEQIGPTNRHRYEYASRRDGVQLIFGLPVRAPADQPTHPCALAAKRARGERLGATPALPKQITRRIIAERREGRTFQAIADGLMADGIPTARGKTVGFRRRSRLW